MGLEVKKHSGVEKAQDPKEMLNIKSTETRGKSRGGLGSDTSVST